MTTTGPATHTTGVHVLVVPGTLGFASELRDADLTVTVAETAAEARNRLDDSVDGVLVGADLPEEDPVSLVADLSDQPVVVVTADGDGQLASDVLAAGATDYVQVATTAEDGTIERVVETVTGARDATGDRDRELEEYETIVEAVPVGVFVLDDEANILRANEKARELVGLDREESLATSVPDLVADGVFEAQVVDLYTDLVADLVSSSTSVEEGTIQFEAYPHGDRRVYEAIITPRPADGQFRGTIGVFQDVTERLRREEQLEAQKSQLQRQKDRLETKRAQLAERTTQLERQNDQLEEFASTLSHELRNPLNTAQGHLKLGRRNDDDEYFETVTGALDRMDRMIDDLLTLAQEGKTVTETAPVDLGEMIERCWDDIETADAELTVGVDATVLADAPRLRQTLENLFHNAVEHGSAGTRMDPETAVEITVGPIPAGAPDDGTPLQGFFIADDGPGIPETDHLAVFEKGYTTDDDNTGFGLSIVESVADAHDWSVSVTESESGGARFEITGVTTPETGPEE